MDYSTIAAISTPPGEGGIGIVRISGPAALIILEKIFQGHQPFSLAKVATHTLHLGRIMDLQGRPVDQVLATVMLAPRTFTGEDVVEINCHGGFLPLQRTLETVLLAGARLAERGEFAKRAFLNGRLDLSQAEGIIDVIRAKTDAGLQAALGQLGGRLGQAINDLRHRLLGILAAIEAGIDFPEEEVPALPLEKLAAETGQLLTAVEGLIVSAGRGRIIRDGISTVIVGRTNVGKSSLLNALLGEKRAIVTEVPGTTRDTIEEYISLGGIPLKIIDTAGIRETQDLVESIGVAKSRALLEEADLLLVVLEMGGGPQPEDLEFIEAARNRQAIVLVNKVDLADSPADRQPFEAALTGIPHLYISAREETGLEQLAEMISQMVLEKGISPADDLLVTSLRHKNCLQRAATHLREVLTGAGSGVSLDILSIDLQEAWHALGEITGDAVAEDLLDRIFADFCIGK